MRRVRTIGLEPCRPLNMTAMIDIVFLLLVFFVMTFRITASEGDFSVDSPPASGGSVDFAPQVPVDVRLIADERGELDSVRFNGQPLGDLDELQVRLAELSQQSFDDPLPLTLHSDFSLRYDHVIRAVTIVETVNIQAGRSKCFALRLRVASQ